MSELKFSCPHCTQHISCDPAWAGHSLQCPSCQKQITVPPPQTGLRVSGQPAGGRLSAKLRANLRQAGLRSSTAPSASPPRQRTSRPAPPVIASTPRASKSVFSLLRIALVLGCLFMLLVGSLFAWSFYRRSLRNKERAEWRENLTRQQTRRPNPVPTGQAAPALYREPKLELPANAVAGQIGGQQFRYEHATVSMHRFVLREGKNWQADREITITTFASPADLAGKTLLVTPDNQSPRLSISAAWLDESKRRRLARAPNGYSLQLKCGPIENGRMSGSIDLQMPGAPATAIKGDFIAAVK